MAKFCVKCGAVLSGAFCGKCGADMRDLVSPAQPHSSQAMSPQTQLPQPVAMQPQTVVSPTPSPAKQGMSGLAKLGIAAVVIIFVGGAAGVVGVYYVAHRVSQKIHQTADGILGSSSDSRAISHGEGSGSGEPESGRSKGGTIGDMCRLLSKDDVSKAIGVEIVRTAARRQRLHLYRKRHAGGHDGEAHEGDGGRRGREQRTQDIAQKFAGGMGNMFQAEKPNPNRTHPEKCRYSLSRSIKHAAEEQLRLECQSTRQSRPAARTARDRRSGVRVSRRHDLCAQRQKSGPHLCTHLPVRHRAVKPLAKKIADAL